MNSNISGCVAARNSIKFGYPLRQCLQALRPICDEVVLAYDPFTDDGTHELALQLKNELDIVLFESRWDLENMKKGFEIGHQSQVAMDACSLKTEWRLCVQQDEAFHEQHHSGIKELVKAAPYHVNGFDFMRLYFYGNLSLIRKDWTIQLTRLTRKGTHTYDGFDGQNSRPLVSPSHCDSRIPMFHYSRIGDPTLIAKRIRNIDSFFHDQSNLPAEENITPYKFITKEYDSYALTEHPREVPNEFLCYQGTHPAPFTSLYGTYTAAELRK